MFGIFFLFGFFPVFWKEGRKEGRKEGTKAGRTEGRKEGRKERGRREEGRNRIGVKRNEYCRDQKNIYRTMQRNI